MLLFITRLAKPTVLILMSALVLGGCNYATLGNIFVLVVTLALFCGTLSMGRRAGPTEQADTGDGETFEG